MNVDEPHPREELSKLLNDVGFIYRIGSPKKTISEKLQLLILKLLILLWEEETEEDLTKTEEKLQLIDDIRHELTFLRAKYYKAIFQNGTGLDF